MLADKVLELRNQFKAEFPAKHCPVFLGRNSDKSLTPLFWRYSSTIKGRAGLRPAVDDFWQEISNLSLDKRARLAEFDMHKIQLNYELSIVSYKLERLKILERDLTLWKDNIRKIK